MLELWAGPECTVNRVGDTFRDQVRESGHHDRESDIDLFCSLGIKAIRYPVLWERIAPDRPNLRNWAWTDRRLTRLRELGIRPIAGLVHHGSGPRYTNLLADGFATGLAAHARAVAERYPWIEDWTPVNEPLTTARFSALYGHWYPHRHDEGSFWLSLLNQIDAVRLSMEAIRTIVPGARLIQTDDLGTTYATATLRDQAAFDNVRRWMGWDLLCGRVTPGHDLWKRLCSFGLGDRLQRIADAPCPPDVVGINHYLTSDRFLDHRVQRYAKDIRGGNGTQVFADVAAPRVLDPAPPGLGKALSDAWDRYDIPLAVTEVHNGCTRDEQMRWIAEAWDTAMALRDEGVDVRAVTAWSLLGSHGWDRLLTRPGSYEPGIFDLRGGSPRPTAAAHLLGRIAGRDPGDRHPLLQTAGWWRRPVRLLHPAAPRPAPMREHLVPEVRATSPLLIVGGRGTLANALAAACMHRGIAHIVTQRVDLDLTDTASVEAALDAHCPWAVVNAAGWVRVDEAEARVAACMAVNADGAAALAHTCAARDISTVSISSDLVFDGRKSSPYAEQDSTNPLNTYGRSKEAAERMIAALPGSHLIVRTAAFFSPFDPHNFAMHVLEALSAGQAFTTTDHIVSPTYVPHLCDAVLDLLIDGETGLWHLTNGEAIGWADFARRLAERLDLPQRLVLSVATDPSWLAQRPRLSALSSRRGMLLPSLDQAIDAFAAEARSQTMKTLAIPSDALLL